MIRFENKIAVISLEDHKEVVKFPFHRRKNITIRAVNRLNIRMTDCSWTYDNMMEDLDKIIILIQTLSQQEMFEVLINLDKKGVANMRQHLFHKWYHSDVPIWDYRKIEWTLKWRHEVLNDLPITRRNYAKKTGKY